MPPRRGQNLAPNVQEVPGVERLENNGQRRRYRQFGKTVKVKPIRCF